MGYPHPIVEDLLKDTIDHAKQRFIIVQLGAHNGTYISLSSRLLKENKPSLDSIAIGIEASPKGYTNLINRMEKFGLNHPPNIFRQIAISDAVSSVDFLENGVSSHMVDHSTGSNDPVIVVKTTTIEQIIKDLSHVDFLEMDIQGAEYKAIPFSMSSISEKAKMICIRTHGSLNDEKQLEDSFNIPGWQKVLVYYNRTLMEIDGKEQPLIDGIQCYVNTNLREPLNIKDVN